MLRGMKIALDLTNEQEEQMWNTVLDWLLQTVFIQVLKCVVVAAVSSPI